MLDDQDAQPLAGHEVGEDPGKALTLGAGQPRGRFIQEQHPRLERQNHRKFECLFQAMAEEARLLAEPLGQTRAIHHGARGGRQRQNRRGAEEGRRVALGARDAQAIGHAQRFKHGGRLEFSSQAETHDTVGRQTRDGLPRYSHRSFRALAAVGETADQSGLAGAVRPDNADEFTLPCLERDARQYRQAAEMPEDAICLDHDIIAVGRHRGALQCRQRDPRLSRPAARRCGRAACWRRRADCRTGRRAARR